MGWMNGAQKCSVPAGNFFPCRWDLLRNLVGVQILFSWSRYSLEVKRFIALQCARILLVMGIRCVVAGLVLGCVLGFKINKWRSGVFVGVMGGSVPGTLARVCRECVMGFVYSTLGFVGDVVVVTGGCSVQAAGGVFCPNVS